MGLIIIEIEEEELKKLENYRVIDGKTTKEQRGREFLANNVSYFNELSNYEQEEIYDCLIKAIKDENAPKTEYDEYDLNYSEPPLGIVVSIHLGRSSFNDMRTYELDRVSVVSAKDADFSVAQYTSFIESQEIGAK